MMSSMKFSVDHGFPEGIVRVFWSSLLSNQAYESLTQCDSLENMRLQLVSSAGYGEYLKTDGTKKVYTSDFTSAAKRKFVENFNFLKANSRAELTKLLEYSTHSYLIDNIAILLAGSIHKVDAKELVDKCHPLGYFSSIGALCVVSNLEELYELVSINSSIGSYLKDCLNFEEFDDLNVEILRNKMYKAYYMDFYKFCKSLGEPTASVMCNILEFESDRRIVTLSVNSLQTNLTPEQKMEMYPECGRLYPGYTKKLSEARDLDQVKQILRNSALYPFFADIDNQDKSLENIFLKYEVKINMESFLVQFQYGVFYSYMKLMEQEIRNVAWISECISQKQKSHVNNYIPLFAK